MILSKEAHGRRAVAVGAALVLLSIVSMTIPSPVAAQDLYIYESEDPAKTFLDPYRGRGAVNERFVSLYCRPLFHYGYYVEDGEDVYESQLAESIVAVDGDSNKIIVTLREDAMFEYYDEFGEQKHSIPVKARDVVTTYNNLINSRSELGSTWYADRLSKVIANMRAVSDRKLLVLFKTNIRRPQWEKVLDFPVVPAEGVPKGAIIEHPDRSNKAEKAQVDYYDKPWGWGPFVLKNISDRQGKMRYWFERVAPNNGRQFNNVWVTSSDLQHMKILLSYLPNDFVCIPSVPIGLSRDIDEEYVIELLIYPHVEQIMFNNSPGTPLVDLRVRRALSMYINRNSLATLYFNEVDLVDGPMPAKYPYYCKDCNIPYYKFNKDGADRLLKEAGYSRNDAGQWMKEDGSVLRVEILGYVGSQGSIVAQIIDHIAEGWKKYGIDSEPKPVTPREYWQRLKEGNFDAAFHRLSYHVVPELSRYFLTGGKENYGHFSDRVVDSLWTAIPTISAAGLQDWWYDMHRRIGEMVPGAFLWTPQDYAVYSLYIDVGQNYYPQNFIGKIEKWEIEY